MRRSDEGQARFTHAETRHDHSWMEEASLMQMEALRKVGLEATPANLRALRTTALAHPELALYVQHNISRDGPLAMGHIAPPAKLIDLKAAPVSWPPVDLETGVPLVVAAGSVS
jgi:hypothetical protein